MTATACSYDGFNRLTGIRHDGETSDRYSYEYGASGWASLVRDSALNRVFQTEHDLCGRPMNTQLHNGDGSLIYRTMLNYDKQNRLVGFGETTGNGSHKTTYSYDNDNRPKELAFDGIDHKLTYTYDSLGRVKQRTVVNGSTLNAQYTYVEGGYGSGSTTPLVESITQGDLTLSYQYDNCGNITSETRNGKTILYTYDSLGQLYRVDDSHENIIWCYYYDRGGNLTERAKFKLDDASWIHSYKFQYRTSGWKDVATSYDGTSLTHDAIGNLTNDGTWMYSWQVGRQLRQMSKSGTTIQFQYDHNGLRAKKTVTSGDTTTNTEYILNGKQIAYMTQGANKLHFFYDAQGRPAMVDYNGVIYTYAHNLQGDIIAILDNTGATIVEYYYDAWGRQYKVTGSMKDTLGKLNPFRYRGYVYDEETGVYYLRSRYYNPEWGRFISADTVMGRERINGHNLFSYCRNTPIKTADTEGTEPYEHFPSEEEAVNDFIECYNGEVNEHSSLIYQSNDDGQYFYGTPNGGEETHTKLPSPEEELLENATAVAFIHSHGNDPDILNAYWPSEEDIEVLCANNYSRAYLSVPDGSLVKMDKGTAKATVSSSMSRQEIFNELLKVEVFAVSGGLHKATKGKKMHFVDFSEAVSKAYSPRMMR